MKVKHRSKLYDCPLMNETYVLINKYKNNIPRDTERGPQLLYTLKLS